LVVHDLEVEGDGGFDGGDVEFAEGALHGGDGFGSGGAVDDEFADHGIVVGGDAVAGVGVGVDADAWAAGEAEFLDQAGGGSEISRRVFGVDAAFDGVAELGDVALFDGEGHPRGDADLFFDQVDAGDLFGDGVLDLDAGVHFQQIEVLFFVDEVFDGAGVDVAGGSDQTDGGFAELFARLALESGARGFFDELLVAALHGAVAFPEVDGVAAMVGHDLDFDVAAELDVFFDVDGGVFEGVFGFGLGLLQAGAQGDVVVGDAHAATATAGGGFDDDGVADFFGDAEGDFFIVDRAVGAGDGGDFGLFRQVFAGDFIADGGHGADGGADEFDLAASADFGEVRVLGEEAVAGMDRLNVRDFGGGDDAGNVQIGFGGWGFADADGLIGEFEICSILVGRRVNDGGLDAHLAAGADDPQGDLTAICYQYL